MFGLGGCGNQTTPVATRQGRQPSRTVTVSSPSTRSPDTGSPTPHTLVVSKTVSNGTLTPTAATTPVGQTGSSVAAQYPKYATIRLVPEVWTVPQGDVALTIDDGPGPYTLSIIHVLQKFHVHATFFFVGSRVNSWAGAVKAAVVAGDVIGDHTETHPLLTNLSPNLQAAQILSAAHEIQQYDPNPITLFRPPYEGFNNTTEQILQDNHMAIALWNRDPRDWAAKTPQQIVNQVVHGNPSGGLFDLHDELLTLEALPAIIQGLQQQGLHIVLLQAPPGDTGIPVSAG